MFKRHDLVFFSRRAIDQIRQSAWGVQPDAPDEYWEELFDKVGTRIPGIVRRQESMRRNALDVGFSSPRRVNGVHYRVSATIPTGDIEQILTPFQVMERAAAGPKAANTAVITAVFRSAQEGGLSVGILGSHALQAVTGLPYVSVPSDFDLIVQGEESAMATYAKTVAELEQDLGFVSDTEARIPFGNGFLDVKLEELLSQSQCVLGKSISDVVLLERNRL